MTPLPHSHPLTDTPLRMCSLRVLNGLFSRSTSSSSGWSPSCRVWTGTTRWYLTTSNRCVSPGVSRSVPRVNLRWGSVYPGALACAWASWRERTASLLLPVYSSAIGSVLCVCQLPRAKQERHAAGVQSRGGLSGEQPVSCTRCCRLFPEVGGGDAESRRDLLLPGGQRLPCQMCLARPSSPCPGHALRNRP
jgi:hypothetical protein